MKIEVNLGKKCLLGINTKFVLVGFKQRPLTDHLYSPSFFTLSFSTTLQWLATSPTHVSKLAIVSLNIY